MKQICKAKQLLEFDNLDVFGNPTPFFFLFFPKRY